MARNRNRSARRRENDANRNSNAAMRRYRQPRMTNDNGIVRITGSELVSVASVSSSPNVTTLRTQFLTPSSGVNQTLYGTWIANMAKNYNKYKFVRLTARYVPFCPTTTAGRVIMAWNGDTPDLLPTNLAQVSQYQNAVEAPVWREISCNALISRNPEYVVGGDNSADDSGVQDQGEFLIGVDNGASSTATSAGSVYIDYELHLWSRAAFSTNT